MRQTDRSTRLRVGLDPGTVTAAPMRRRLRLSRIAAFVGLALLVYLPLEPALLSPLRGLPYWILRLLPDALIAVLATATLWVDRGAYRTPDKLISAVIITGFAITAITVVRGQSAEDAINAQRVLLRYALLGLVLWRSVPDQASLPLRMIQTIILAGAIQVVIGLASVIWSVATTGSFADSVFLAGTVGRYDRYGPLLAAMALGILAWSMASGMRVWFWPLLISAAPLLYLSTSRQAMAGLVVAALVAAVLPRVTNRIRVLAAIMAASAALMILLTPSKIAAPANAYSDEGPSISVTATPIPSNAATAVPSDSASETAQPIAKGGSALSSDPRRNFRLYLLLVVLPWAAEQEPLVGFGPGQQSAVVPDPRLEQFVANSGLRWSAVVGYMNNSQYASLVIQFGIPATMAFLALLIGSLGIAARAALSSNEPVVRFSLFFGLMALTDAALGPFFEARTDSILLWIPLLVAVGLANGHQVRCASSTRDRSFRESL